jgi:hypothetical protein
VIRFERVDRADRFAQRGDSGGPCAFVAPTFHRLFPLPYEMQGCHAKFARAYGLAAFRPTLVFFFAKAFPLAYQRKPGVQL